VRKRSREDVALEINSPNTVEELNEVAGGLQGKCYEHPLLPY
jgi:hypothetical protein